MYPSVKLDEEKIKKIKTAFKEFRGCQKTCPQKPTNQHECLKMHISALLKNQKKRNDDILRELHHHQLEQLSSDEKRFVKLPKILGCTMCWNCFAFLMGVSLRTIDSRKKDVLTGHMEFLHAGAGQSNRPKPKTAAVTAFIQKLCEERGQSVPDKDEIELPPSTKEVHYIEFMVQQEAAKSCTCTYGWFCKLWKREFSHIKIPAHPRWVCLFHQFTDLFFR